MDSVATIQPIITYSPTDDNSDLISDSIVFSLPVFLIVFLITGLCCTFCCYVLRSHRSAINRRSSIEDVETAPSTSQPEVLTKINYKKKWLKKNSSSLKNDMCTICLDDFRHKDQISVCVCGHAYHHKCIMKWLEVKRTCPICQRRVKGSKACERTPLLSSSVET